MGWERARTDEQKEQRIAEIIDATARLYETQPFEAITFVSIAKTANFTRSNLYKYFNSKEEIFFEFLKQDVIRWRKDLVKTISKKNRYSVDEFVAVWLKVQGRHGRMQDLISILYDFLEKNASIERMVDFKRLAKEEYAIVTELLCQRFAVLVGHVDDDVTGDVVDAVAELGGESLQQRCDDSGFDLTALE